MKRALVVLAGLLSACGYKPPGPPVPHDATEVDASLGHTWDAVIDVFAERSIPIRTIERASGIIATDQLSVGPDGQAWADCGTDNRGKLRPNAGIYNVLVRGDSSSSRVRATVRWRHVKSSDDLHECSTTHVWEQAFEEGVKARAESQGSLAPAPVAGTMPPPPQASSPGAADATLRPGERTTTSAASIPPPRATALKPLRPGTELLRDEIFATAVTDLQALDAIQGFGESGHDTLRVQLTEAGVRSLAITHYLRRLFYAYRGLTENINPDAVLLLTRDGRVAGVYTQSGLSKRDWR